MEIFKHSMKLKEERVKELENSTSVNKEEKTNKWIAPEINNEFLQDQIRSKGSILTSMNESYPFTLIKEEYNSNVLTKSVPSIKPCKILSLHKL